MVVQTNVNIEVNLNARIWVILLLEQMRHWKKRPSAEGSDFTPEQRQEGAAKITAWLGHTSNVAPHLGGKGQWHWGSRSPEYGYIALSQAPEYGCKPPGSRSVLRSFLRSFLRSALRSLLKKGRKTKRTKKKRSTRKKIKKGRTPRQQQLQRPAQQRRPQRFQSQRRRMQRPCSTAAALRI